MKRRPDAPFPNATRHAELVANIATDAERLVFNCQRLAAETE
jgi:hypothetical protein